MIPLKYDLFIGAICTVAGVIALHRIGAFSFKKYTPALSAMAILLGLIAWASVTLVTFSGLTEHPEWLYSKGWTGSWSYSFGRFFMALYWLMTLVQITKYSPKHPKQVKVKL